jgi:serine/threonine protein kinase/tetratricopeptide (TPR) repeat protein
MSDTELRPPLSPAEARQIDQACDRFEAAWKAGQRPRPQEYLGPAGGPARAALLRQLLLLDWDYRQRAGDNPHAAEYHAVFPGDSALIEEVRRELLESREAVDGNDRLDRDEAIHQAATAPPAAPAEGPGRRIGPYKLLQQIGEGGMGTVFMAEQRQPVRRKVALKIVKPGMDSQQVIARFEAERQALAMMDHQNIARVLDAGETPPAYAGGSPRPYFVMELVHGVPITQFCDEPKLTPRQRLELFVPVCQAIQHAHQKGIIHRDIKPSNVLVTMYDDKPVPKVIDFGVAKAVEQRLTEKTMFTQFGAFVGTFDYMSPEQAEMNAFGVDTRSDIYSLGVLLYELLTGTTPLEQKRLRQAALPEMVRLIKEEEAPRPSVRLSTSHDLPKIAAARNTEPARLSKLIRGDIDWIVMKCLEKDRTRRYESAGGLARDIQRHLADEPVEACPPSALYRFRKFARRNKGPVLAAGLVLLALVVGVVGTTLGLLWAEQQRQIAQDNEQKAVAAAEAEAKAKQSAQAREAETKAVLEFVENKVFAAARPEGQAGGLGRDVTLRSALEAALPFVDQGFPNQPLIEARLRLTLGTSFGNLGEAKIAADQTERAWSIYRKHLGPDHPDTLASMANLAICYASLGRQADALKLQEETLAFMKVKLGRDHPVTLANMNNLALSYAALGRQVDALKLHEQTLALKKARFGPNHPATLGSMNNLALTYNALGRHADALKLGQKTLALTKAKFGLDHRATLGSMDTLALIYNDCGQPGKAVKLYEETLALMKVKLGRDHPMTLGTMNNLANSYRALGRHGEELKLRESTLALRTAKLGLDHPDILASMDSLARLLATSADSKVRNPSRAVALASKAVELGPKSGHFWNTLGAAHYRAGAWEAAIAALNRSMKLRKGGDSFDWFFLAMAHWRLGDKVQARKWYDRAIQWMEKNVPRNEELRRFRAEAGELMRKD